MGRPFPSRLCMSGGKGARMVPSVVDLLHFEPLDAAPDACRRCLGAREAHSEEGHCPTPAAHLFALLRARRPSPRS